MAARLGYVTQGEGKDRGFRLDREEVVTTGRRREFRRSLEVFVGLYAVQLPMREVALGQWKPAAALPAVQSARLSLLMDLAFITAYVYVAYRAFGMARSHRVSRLWLQVCHTGLVCVLAGAVLDIYEDYRLWHVFPGPDPQHPSLSLSLHQALPWLPLLPHTDAPWYSRTVQLLVGIGLLALIYTALVVPPKLPPPIELDDETAAEGSPNIVICCSGGGMRAAAFSLGGLQALRTQGIYQRASAVLGVSGGGYIAAAHHVLRWGPADVDDQPRAWESVPDELPTYGLGSPETQWVRRHTQYVLESVRVATDAALSLFFGIAVNLLLVTLALGGTAWVLAWLFLVSGRLQPWPDLTSLSGNDRTNAIAAGMGGHFSHGWAVLGWTWVIPAVGVGLFVATKSVDRFHTLSLETRQMMSAWSAQLLWVGAGFTLLIQGVPAVVQGLSHYAATSGTSYAGLLHQFGFVPSKVCHVIIATQDSCGASNRSGVAGRSSSTVVGSVSVVTVVSAILAVLGSAKGAATSTEASTFWRGLGARVWAKIKDPLVPWTAVTVIVAVAALVTLVWITNTVQTFEVVANWKVAALVGLLLIFTKIVTEPNRTSMHSFFRERISQAFLVRRVGNRIEPLDYQRPLRFSQSTPTDGGPRLVACAVANVSDDDLVPSRRGCTPFVFDDQAIGLTDQLLPPSAARRQSEVYEYQADPKFRVATIPAAVAISAAAFSPLAGRENVRLGPYRAVLALGNARLGVWLPNPIWIDEPLLVRRLLRRGRYGEAARLFDALPEGERRYLNLSEGQVDKLERGRRMTKLARLSAQLHHLGDGEDPGAFGRIRDEAAQLGADVTNAQDRRTLLTAIADARKAGLTRLQSVLAVYEGIRDVFKKPGLFRLVKEAVGRASVYDRFLYVTDGGHYDNLGLVEALRRRPDYVIVLDASNDRENAFSTLGKAIATARMDLDCEVLLDPTGMTRPSDQASTASAWCRGTFRFADGSKAGEIFLVKAVKLQGVTWDISAYGAENPDFPRTSTTRQLYSEFDFEAYRALGTEAVNGFLRSAMYLDNPLPGHPPRTDRARTRRRWRRKG